MRLDEFRMQSAVDDRMQVGTRKVTIETVSTTSSTFEGTSSIVGAISSSSRDFVTDDESDIENDVDAALLILAEMEENDRRRKGSSGCLGLIKEARTALAPKLNSPNALTTTSEANSGSNNSGDHYIRSLAMVNSLSRKPSRQNSYPEETYDDDTLRALEILAEMEKNERSREGSSDCVALIQQKGTILALQINGIEEDDRGDSKRALEILAEMEAKENEDDAKRAQQILTKMEEDEKKRDGSSTELRRSGALQKPISESYTAADMKIDDVANSSRNANTCSEEAENDAKRALQLLAEMDSAETDDEAEYALQILAEMDDNRQSKKATTETDSGDTSKVDSSSDMLSRFKPYFDEIDNEDQRALQILAGMDCKQPKSDSVDISSRLNSYFGETDDDAQQALQILAEIEEIGYSKKKITKTESSDESKVHSSSDMSSRFNSLFDDTDDDVQRALQILAEMEESEKPREGSTNSFGLVEEACSSLAQKQSCTTHSVVETNSSDVSAQHSVLSETVVDYSSRNYSVVTAVVETNSSDASAKHSVLSRTVADYSSRNYSVVTAVVETYSSDVSANHSVLGQTVVNYSSRNSSPSLSTYSREIEDDTNYQRALELLSSMENEDDTQRALEILAEMEEKEKQGNNCSGLIAAAIETKHSDVLQNRSLSPDQLTSVPPMRAAEIEDDSKCGVKLLADMSPSSAYSAENDDDNNYALQILAEMELNEKKLNLVTESGSSDACSCDNKTMVSNNVSPSRTQIEAITKKVTKTKSSSGSKTMASYNMPPLNARIGEMIENENTNVPGYFLKSKASNARSPGRISVQSRGLDARPDTTMVASSEGSKHLSSGEEDTEPSSQYNPESHWSTSASGCNDGNYVCSEQVVECNVLLSPNTCDIHYDKIMESQSCETAQVGNTDKTYTKETLLEDDAISPSDFIAERNTNSIIAKKKRGISFRSPFNFPPNPPPPRNAHEIITSYTNPIETVNVSWCKPSLSIVELINTIRGASGTRRCNACGTLKMLTSNEKNKLTLARTEGVLDVFRFIIELKPSLTCPYALSSRVRVMSAVHNLSIRTENRALIIHAGLMPGLVNAAKDDRSEARVIACSILALLAKSEVNQLRMVNTPGLVTVLSEVLAATASGMEAITKDRKAKNASEEEQTDEDEEEQSCEDSDSSSSVTATDDSCDSSDVALKGDDKYVAQTNMEQQIAILLNPARASACAAFIHLSKDCASIAQLCKNETLLNSLAKICVEFDFEVHTKGIEVLCNLTRMPSNQKILAGNVNVIQSLTACLSSNLVDDRKWAARALQNICSDQSSKVSIAKQPLLTALSLSAMSKEADEQFAAVAALLNLSCEPGVVTAMSNTKNVVSTLIHLTYDISSSAQVRLMACDALASIGLWLQTVASSAPVPDGMESKLPTYITSGWERYD